MSKLDATEIAYRLASSMLFALIEIMQSGVNAVEYSLAIYIFFLLFSALLGGSPYLIYKYIIANRAIYVNIFFINFYLYIIEKSSL